MTPVAIKACTFRLAEGIGGALLLSLVCILCLAACVGAFGRSVPFAKVGLCT